MKPSSAVLQIQCALAHCLSDRRTWAGILLGSIVFCSPAHAQMRMWKRGAPGGFSAILYLQNSGTEAQQCSVSWGNANGGFGNSTTIIVQPGQTQDIQTGVVAVNESYRCKPFVDLFKQREREKQEAERRRREQEAQQQQRTQDAQRRNQAGTVSSMPAQGQPYSGGASQYSPGSASMPSPTYGSTPAYTPQPYIPPASGSSARNQQMLGTAAQAIGMLGNMAAEREQREQREEQQRLENAERKRQEAAVERDTEAIMQRALQEAARAPDVNPWRGR